MKTQYTFKSDHHTLYTQKLNKIALNFFDDKRIQCNDKITTYPYGYFDNTSNIIDEIKNNTKELNNINNSAIIPKNYIVKVPIEKDINITNEIIANNADIYADSTYIDSITCTYAYEDSLKRTCIDIIKSTNAYIDSKKITCIDEIKSSIYANSAKSACIDKIKCNNINMNSIKSIFAKKSKLKNTNKAHSIIADVLNMLLKI